jgi:hypothetical protein
MSSGFLSSELTGEDLLRLEPPRASLGQLQLTNRMEMVRIDGDVLGVVERLKSIDPGLVLMYDKGQSIYVLYWEGMRAEVPGGPVEMHEDLVGAYTELDSRLITLIERIDAQGRGRHDLQAELEKLEAKRDAEEDHRQSEQMGETFERLRHSLRNDLGLNGSSVQMTSSRGIHRARSDQRRRRKRKG